MAKANNSPLASLASKATTASATASNAPRKPANFTGQYFLERFVTDRDETTKMNVLRQVVSQIDTASLKSSLNDMVELAKKKDVEAGIDESVVTREGPLYRAAANSRSIIQRIFGALRFAEDEMTARGYTETLGYLAASSLAKASLDAKTIKWDGTQAKTVEERNTQRQFRAEERALKEVQNEHPRQPTETLEAYSRRTLAMVKAKIDDMQAEAEQERIDSEVNRLLEAYGPEGCKAIIAALAEAINVEEPALV